MLLVDGGDSLSRLWPSSIDARDRKNAEVRAAFLLRTMGALGYQAMAVGERDLVFPVAELKQKAAAAKVTLLAANVVDAQGRRPFAERTLIQVGGRKVGVFAVTEGAEFERLGLRVLLPGDVAVAQAQALRKEGATLVVALLHLGYDASLKLAGNLSGVDFVVQAHDGRVASPQKVGAALLAAGGERGRQLGRVAFQGLDLPGPAFDLSEADQAKSLLPLVEQQLADTLRRMAQHPEDKARLEPAMKAQSRRRDELKAKVAQPPPAGRRTVLADFVTLDGAFPDDPVFKKMVDETQAAAPERR